MEKGFKKAKTRIEEHDFNLAADYWMTEFPSMDAKTRSNIQVGVMGTLHVFNTGEVRELASTTTNISPADMEGKFILLNMPPAEYGDMGLLVAAGWKFLTQKYVLRRPAGESINVIWADEAQHFVSSFDAHYLAQCRSQLGCMVYLTQSMHSYFAAMRGEQGEHQAEALLTNFSHKIAHAIGDEKTAKWLSGLIGRKRTCFVGTSTAPTENLSEELFGWGKVTTSTSEHIENILEPRVFMNGLRTSGGVCDAIIIRSGSPFSSGHNWLQREFKQ